MISDSIINSSIPSASKDFGKKKRANRSAKLKQCKLDARRQQWLNQVNNNGLNSEGNGNNAPVIETRKEKRKERERVEVCCKGVEVRSVNIKQIENCDGDSEEEVMANSPTSSVNDSVNSYGGSSSSSSSSSSRSSASSVSFGSGGCCSGSITEEEESRGPEFGGDDDDDDGCLDDWETVADALVGVETKNKQGFLDDEARVGSAQNVNAQVEKGKSVSVGIVGRGGVNSKAWRPDDASRPQSLPNLSTHMSFLGNSERVSCRGLNPWGRKMTPPAPTSCPICCEDLDLTDSSFLPCPCGFHLCLFCHKRILEEDARCPGCRKPYSSEAVDKDATVRLARSCSMFSRV